jgi:nucleotide-binding universal stress UspA family protein
MKKILIAIDYNPSAQKVAETGYQLAKSMNAEIVLLHVVADYTYYSSLDYSPIMGFDTFSNLGVIQTNSVLQLEDAAHEFLEKSKSHLGDSSIQTLVKDGDTGDAIIEAAENLNVDVIVLGSHSRKGLDKILMGSVAEKVLRHSKIPLFVIPVSEKKEK